MTETPADAWDGSLYAANTAHHRAYDDRLLDSLEPAPGHRALDIGCGVGDFTVRLADIVGGTGEGHVTGIDRSADMIATASSTHDRPDMTFRVLPAQELATTFEDDSFERIISVACLHWIDGSDHPQVLAACHRLLAPGGRMVLDFGGQGQIAAVLDIVDEFAVPMNFPACPWYFPGTEYRDLVVAAGFHDDAVSVELVHQVRPMATFDDLCGWLDSQVLVAWKPYLAEDMWGALRAGVFQKAYTGLRRDDGSYDVDYVRCSVMATR